MNPAAGVLAYHGEQPYCRSPAGLVLGLAACFASGVPLLGYWGNSGPVMMLGGVFSFVSAPACVVGLLGSLRSWVIVVWAVALALNSTVAAYFVWLFFIRGLC